MNACAPAGARGAPATPAGVRIVVPLLPGGSLRSPPANFLSPRWGEQPGRLTPLPLRPLSCRDTHSQAFAEGGKTAQPFSCGDLRSRGPGLELRVGALEHAVINVLNRPQVHLEGQRGRKVDGDVQLVKQTQVFRIARETANHPFQCTSERIFQRGRVEGDLHSRGLAQEIPDAPRVELLAPESPEQIGVYRELGGGMESAALVPVVVGIS